jgi:monoamine oxidase
MKSSFKTPFLRLLQREVFKNHKVHTQDHGRRGFLKNTSVLAATAALPTGFLSSCINSDASRKNHMSVAILGGGLAGLNAGYTLMKQNVDFKIFESSSRVGGRVFSVKDVVADGVTTELGGEYIDSNHEDMLKLANEFGLELMDCEQDIKGNNLREYACYFNGKHYTEDQVITEFKKYSKAIEADISNLAQNEEVYFEQFDKVSATDYFKSKGINGWFYDMLVAALTAEYGLESSEQSSLNFLYMLDTNTDEGFKIYGDSDERYKIKGGNSRVAEKLKEKLSSTIILNSHCTEISQSENGEYVLTFGKEEKYTAKYLIVAIPFTALRKIKLGFPISEKKRFAIDNLSYGTNSKIVFGTKSRLWREQGFSGYLFNDKIQNGWDSSLLQLGNKGGGGYTVFVGGKAGRELNDSFVEEYAAQLNSVYDGFQDQLNGQKAIFNWSISSLVEGSYSAFSVGQWTSVASEVQKPEGNMYFAGEHCSENFQGYMNGAAETGRVAAEGILKILTLKS